MSHATSYRSRFVQIATETLDKMISDKKIRKQTRARTLRFIRSLSPIGGHTDSMMRQDVRWIARRFERQAVQS